VRTIFEWSKLVDILEALKNFAMGGIKHDLAVRARSLEFS
jgi:hypothetical protein